MNRIVRGVGLAALAILLSSALASLRTGAHAAEKKPRKPLVDQKLLLQSLCEQLAKEAKARDAAEARMDEAQRGKVQAARKELAKKKAEELRQECKELQKAQAVAARKRQGPQAKALLAQIASLRKTIERLESGELEVVTVPKSDLAPDGAWIVDRAALIELGGDYAAHFDARGNRLAPSDDKQR